MVYNFVLSVIMANYMYDCEYHLRMDVSGIFGTYLHRMYFAQGVMINGRGLEMI